MATKTQVSARMPHVELFEGLSLTDAQKFFTNAYEREIAGTEIIFRAHEPRRSIFLLLEGQAKVTQHGKNGDDVMLWFNLPGQIVGSLVLAPEGTYSATAQAIQAGRMAVWDYQALDSNLREYPVLVRNAQRIIARQYGELSCRLREISTETAETRLASELVRLIGQVGRRANGNFELDLSQRELAQMTAMSHCTANRQLSEWRRRGLLTRRHRTIVILDFCALERLAVTSS